MAKKSTKSPKKGGGLGPHSKALKPRGGLGPHSAALNGLQTSGTDAPKGTGKGKGPQPDGGLGPHS